MTYQTLKHASPSTATSGKLYSPPRGRKQLSPGFNPGSFDVICARGKQCYNHEGNVRFRHLVGLHVEEYTTAICKYQKSQIVNHILNTVRSLSPHGGFVRMVNGCNEQWVEVGDRAAKEKIGQTFRDLRPKKCNSNTTKFKTVASTAEQNCMSMTMKNSAWNATMTIPSSDQVKNTATAATPAVYGNQATFGPREVSFDSNTSGMTTLWHSMAMSSRESIKRNHNTAQVMDFQSMFINPATSLARPSASNIAVEDEPELGKLGVRPTDNISESSIATFDFPSISDIFHEDFTECDGFESLESLDSFQW